MAPIANGAGPDTKPAAGVKWSIRWSVPGGWVTETPRPASAVIATRAISQPAMK